MSIKNTTTITQECNCPRGTDKIVDPIIVSATRIIYNCRNCGGLVAWSDSDEPSKIKMVDKIRPKLEALADDVLNKWA